MYVLKNICFLCLTVNDKHLKTVLQNNIEDETFLHVKYALPELEILVPEEIPVYICSSCSITLGLFCKFKKKCLDNYSRWKHYIQILQGTNNIQEHTYSDLQIKLIKCEAPITQQQELDAKLNIKEENEDYLSPLSGNEEQIFNDVPMINQDLELHIIPDIKYIDNTVVEDKTVVKKELSAEQEETFTVTLNIKDENEDAFLLSQEQTNLKNDIKQESLSPEKTGGNGSSDTSDEDTNSEKLKCIMCKKLFSEKSALDIHLRNHIRNTKGVECVICESTFTVTDSLRCHLKLHFGFKDYECSKCHKAYVCRGSLNAHKKRHESGRGDECKLCHKKFIELKKHMRTHAGVKQYGCAICKKKFIERDALKEHLKQHAAQWANSQKAGQYNKSVANNI